MSRILVGKHQNKKDRGDFRLRRVCAAVLNKRCKLQGLQAFTNMGGACVNLT